MRWEEVVTAFTKRPWEERNGRRYMYIYDRGTITALPRVPREWYRAFIPWVQRGCVTCTFGLDWWFEEIRIKRNNQVEHGILFSMDAVFYHYVRTNWALMEDRRLRNASWHTSIPKRLALTPVDVSCSRGPEWHRVVF